MSPISGLYKSKNYDGRGRRKVALFLTSQGSFWILDSRMTDCGRRVQKIRGRYQVDGDVVEFQSTQRWISGARGGSDTTMNWRERVRVKILKSGFALHFEDADVTSRVFPVSLRKYASRRKRLIQVLKKISNLRRWDDNVYATFQDLTGNAYELVSLDLLSKSQLKGLEQIDVTLYEARSRPAQLDRAKMLAKRLHAKLAP